MKNFQIWILFLLLSITVFSNDQYIYSQITKDNLVATDQYIVDGFDLEGEESVFSVETGDINLENFLKSDSAYAETSFIKIENERYEYNGVPRSMVKFNFKKNTEEPKEANFNLTQVDESGDIPIYKRLLDENYMVSAPLTSFIHLDLEPSKNIFIYEDKYELEHLIAYKYQEVVYRLYVGTKKDNLIPLKKVQVDTNLDNFYNSNDYIDFVFENNGSVQIVEKDGITGKFIDGKFELMGLESGKTYNLDLYTLRYRNNNNVGNYVAVTYESSLSFTGKNQGSIQGNTAWLEDIDISNFKNIGLNIITITSDDLSEIGLKNIEEKRGTLVNTPVDMVISAPTSLSGSSINIDGTNYDVIDDQIVVGSTTYSEYVEVNGVKYPLIGNTVTIEGTVYTVVDNKITIGSVSYSVVTENLTIDEKKYVYRWTGSYDTNFTQEEGEERVVSFDIEGTDIAVNGQAGKYIEPIPVVKDERYPHQRVIFESKDGSGNIINYELKSQNYQMIDRILTPSRLGYRQIKSIDYESTLGEYLLGGGYLNINEFQFINNNWNYLVDEGVEGIMVEKTISEAMAELEDEDGDKIEFYTDDTGSGLHKVEEGGDKVVYNWNEGPSNTNGVILNYDKVIFRIIKMPEDGVITENIDYMVGGVNHTAELPSRRWTGQ